MLDLSPKNRDRTSYQFLSAFTGGYASGFFTGPIELGLIRQQRLIDKQTTKNYYNTIRDLTKKHGPRKILFGTHIAGIRDGCVNSGFLFFAPLISKLVNEKYNYSAPQANLIGGIIGGLISQIVSQPFDTLKTIKQANLAQDSLFKIASSLYQNLGLKGFYLGSFYRGLRVTSGITMLNSLNPITKDLIRTYITNETEQTATENTKNR